MDYDSLAKGLALHSVLKNDFGAHSDSEFAMAGDMVVEAIHSLDLDTEAFYADVRTTYGIDASPTIHDCKRCAREGGMVFMLNPDGQNDEVKVARRVELASMDGMAEQEPFAYRIAVPKSVVDSFGDERGVRQHVDKIAETLTAHHVGALWVFRVVGSVNENGTFEQLPEHQPAFKSGTEAVIHEKQHEWIEVTAREIGKQYEEATLRRSQRPQARDSDLAR